MAEHEPFDDVVLRSTRALAVVVVPVLVVAVGVLFGFPSRTESLWAWPIKPHMSSFLLASAYAGGLYYFARVLSERRWHRIAAGLPAIWAFVCVEGAATVVHWDRFSHDNVAFWLWAGLYFTTPVLIPLVWLRNRAADPGIPEDDDAVLPAALRAALAAMGTIQLGLAVFLFAFPATAARFWGWDLTPLTARSASGWFALGVGGIVLAFETRWSAARIFVESLCVVLVVLAIGALRARNEFHTGRTATWIFIGGLTAGLASFLWVHVVLQRSRRVAEHAVAVPHV